MASNPTAGGEVPSEKVAELLPELFGLLDHTLKYAQDLEDKLAAESKRTPAVVLDKVAAAARAPKPVVQEIPETVRRVAASALVKAGFQTEDNLEALVEEFNDPSKGLEVLAKLASLVNTSTEQGRGVQKMASAAGIGSKAATQQQDDDWESDGWSDFAGSKRPVVASNAW